MQLRLVALAAGILLGCAVARGQDSDSQPGESKAAESPPARPGADDDVRRAARAMLQRGAGFLLASQGADGGWNLERGPGISALALTALARQHEVGPGNPAVKRGVESVLKFQRPDGGIYSAEGLLKNYETSVALMMLSAMKEHAPREARDRAQQFLIDNQWDEGDGKSVDDPWYGGAGYGSGKRPDLSNTQMMLEALHDSGLPPDHPTFQKALVFIQRCQMLGESNDQPFARSSRDGGFIYSPANGGESKAGTVELDGRTELRTYGSMTYAGFKSLLYAGVKRDDPRVRAAVDWIRRHWTLQHNPNMPERQSSEGLYYYYHVFARAMQAWGEPVIEDRLGQRRDWRRELVDALAARQTKDGSWQNEADRWMEGHPALTTAYSMLALQAVIGADLGVE